MTPGRLRQRARHGRGRVAGRAVTVLGAALAMPMALLLAMAPACKSRDQPGGETARDDHTVGHRVIEARTVASGDMDALPSVEPDWARTLERSAEAYVLEHVAGPVLAGKSVLVSSSAIGVAAVDAASGALRWQRGDHPATRPVLWQGQENGQARNRIWLSGPCARARPGGLASPAMGCVEILDGDALVIEDRTRLAGLPDAPGDRGGLPSQRGALGAWGPALLWAQGPDVLALEPGRDDAWTRYRVPDALELQVCGWLAGDENLAGGAAENLAGGAAENLAGGAAENLAGGAADDLIVATCDGLAGFSRASREQLVVTPAWHVRATRTTSVAGPVRAGSRVLWAHDEALEAVDRGRTAWRAPGRYAHAPGGVHALGTDRALALSLDRGIRPAVIDVARGQVLSLGQRAPGIQVLAAVLAHDGAVLAVRLDSSLLRDAIVAYDDEHRIAWVWPVPAPATPRADAIGLAMSEQAVFVFHDGQHLVRLPRP